MIATLNTGMVVMSIYGSGCMTQIILQWLHGSDHTALVVWQISYCSGCMAVITLQWLYGTDHASVIAWK